MFQICESQIFGNVSGMENQGVCQKTFHWKVIGAKRTASGKWFF